MNAVYRELAERIRGEVPDLEHVIRFRHLVRSVYTMSLVPEKMAGLMSALRTLWPGLRAELLAFADFLEALAQTSQTEG